MSGHFSGDAADGGQFFSSSDTSGIYQPGIMPIAWIDRLVPRADFDPSEMQRLIWNYGIPCLWELWAPCPCGHEQAAHTDCPQCHGTGRNYYAQQEVLAAVTGVKRNWQQWERMGPMEPGTAMFLCRGEHCPSLGDRFTITHAHIPLTLAAVRRAALADPDHPTVHAIERLRYPVVPQVIEIRDEANNRTPQSFGVMFLQGQGEDNKPMDPLVEGTDFDVTIDGWLDWTKGDLRGTTPAPGKLFSIYYRTRPVYRVEDFPIAFRDTMVEWKSPAPVQMPLPVEFMGKLEWLIEAGA